MGMLLAHQNIQHIKMESNIAEMLLRLESLCYCKSNFCLDKCPEKQEKMHEGGIMATLIKTEQMGIIRQRFA